MAHEILLCGAATVGQLPGILHGGRIVAMPDHAPAIEHQGLQSLLGQLLGGPAAADARSDDDCIVGVLVHGSVLDRKSTRLNSSHDQISYAVFCLKKKKNK